MVENMGLCRQHTLVCLDIDGLNDLYCKYLIKLKANLYSIVRNQCGLHLDQWQGKVKQLIY